MTISKVQESTVTMRRICHSHLLRPP